MPTHATISAAPSAAPSRSLRHRTASARATVVSSSRRLRCRVSRNARRKHRVARGERPPSATHHLAGWPSHGSPRTFRTRDATPSFASRRARHSVAHSARRRGRAAAPRGAPRRPPRRPRFPAPRREHRHARSVWRDHAVRRRRRARPRRHAALAGSTHVDRRLRHAGVARRSRIGQRARSPFSFALGRAPRATHHLAARSPARPRAAHGRRTAKAASFAFLNVLGVG